MKIPLEELVKNFPLEDIFQNAYNLSFLWAKGEVKMPIAKRAILDCHRFSKSISDPYYISLCHAIAQGCSTVHTETHALGLVFYELTSIVIKCDYKNYEDFILEKINFYYEKLKYWENNALDYERNNTWAEFLIRPGKINKEKLLEI